MGLKFSVEVRNAQLDAIEAAIGAAAILKIREGSPPSNITDADSGTVLSTISLPSNWMADAAGGSKSKSGTWRDATADATGTDGHFRIYAADGVTQHMQGEVGTSNAVMTVDTTSFTATRGFAITSFALTAGNA